VQIKKTQIIVLGRVVCVLGVFLILMEREKERDIHRERNVGTRKGN